MMNYVRIGTLVLFIHDVGDIFVNLTKALVDTYYTKCTAVSWFLLTNVWAITRLYIFPAWVIQSTCKWNCRLVDFLVVFEGIQLVNEEHHHGYYFFNFMLMVLLMLHVYWFGLLVKFGVRMVKYGEKEDFSHEKQVAATGQ